MTILNQCPDPNPLEPKLNIDGVNPLCPECPQSPSQKDVDFFEDIKKTLTKTGLGQSGSCDPIQAGHIAEDLSKKPNRNTIYRYSKGIRGCDEAMLDLFRDVIVINEQGTSFPVPIIWGSQERAVTAILQPNVRKDTSLVTDRLQLPMMAINSTDMTFNPARYVYHGAVSKVSQREKYAKDTVLGYTVGLPIDIGYQLTLWTYYIEDMHQILEQVISKIHPMTYIRVQGVWWEIAVKPVSIANNIDTDPGDTALRIVKYQLNMTAETFLPQPIRRDKAVLKTAVNLVDGIDDETINQVISTVQEAAEELRP